MFDPQNPHPLTDHQKFVASDYVNDHYNCAKFGTYLSMGGLLGKWVKYNEIFLSICLHFLIS